MSQLVEAADRGDLPAVRARLAAGDNVNAVSQGFSAIHQASYEGHLDVVRELLKAGANVNAVDQYRETAILLASYKGRLDVVRELLKAGANVNAVDQDEDTALHCASLHGHLDVARELLRAGADPTLKNKEGKTARDRAKNDEMRHLLKEAERTWQAKQQAIASLMRNRLDGDCFRALPLQIRLEMRTFVLCLTHLRWRVPHDVQHLIFLELLRSRPLIVDESKTEKKEKEREKEEGCRVC